MYNTAATIQIRTLHTMSIAKTVKTGIHSVTKMGFKYSVVEIIIIMWTVQWMSLFPRETSMPSDFVLNDRQFARTMLSGATSDSTVV